MYKTLRAIVTLCFAIFFQSSFSDGKFILSHLYLFIKGLIFLIPSACFPISSWSNVTVPTYWKHLLSSLLIGFIIAFLFFIQSGESIYDPLLYDIYNAINDHNRRQNHYLSWFQIMLISIFNWIKKFFLNFICFVINHDFYVITFWMHYTLFIM